MAYIGNKPANKPVVASDLDPTVITGQTALAVAPADTDEFLISDAGTLKRLDASLIGGGGKVLQVVSVNKTDTFSSTSTSFTDVTGLTANITPSATSSKILVNVSISAAGDGGARYAYNLVRGSTNILLGDAASSRTRSSISGLVMDGHFMTSNSIVFLDSPSSTSSTTYKIQGRAESGNAFMVNKTATDSDAATIFRPASTITLIEIGA